MKATFLTFSATLAVVTMAASFFFFNSILGALGLVALPAGELLELKASQKIVEKIKERHNHKKVDASKRISKRAAKKVASTAAAAATVGTVAVAATTASLEVADYCEEKASLQEDENILYGTEASFGLEQCIEEGKEDSKVIMAELKSSSIEAVSNAFNAASEYSSQFWNSGVSRVKSWLAE
jgi:hypothetical protein